jgi:Skp family chaperone for outer membrane proteins
MTSKLARLLTFAAFVLSVTALAQTGSSAAALPSAPSSPPTAVVGAGAKIGTINIEQAIFASNEGQREFEQLSKKLEPKQTELKSRNDELDSLKKQLQAQSDKLNDDARNTLVKQIDQKQKSFDRDVQDARDDAQNQQNEIAQRILQKMAPLLSNYAKENGYGLILDTSNPWPQGPVIMAGPPFDITKTIVEAYNAQSGVAAPTASSRPAATHAAAKPATPAGGTAKPATPTGTKP